MDAFPFMKDCLKEFDYPNLHGCTDQQIAGIFNPPNRCFLVCWLLKKINNSYETVLETCANNEELLAGLIYEQGFCTAKEKLAFIRGELPIVEQVKILYKMFKYLKDISSNKENIMEEKCNVSFEDLFELANRNLNLFPVYGKLKLMDEANKQTKIRAYRKEIDGFSNRPPNATKKVEELSVGEQKRIQETLQKDLEEIKVQLPALKPLIQNICKNAKVSDSPRIRPESVTILRETNKNIHKICQYMQNMNTIKEFTEAGADRNIVDVQIKNEDFQMMQNLVQEFRKLGNK